MTCKHSYEKMSDRTKKYMLFCRAHEKDGISKLCICQKFCPDKNKYVANEQKKYCRDYE